jgi:lipid II:glycine glycyltransferase (peptidoglycan interpeptide bridge formation enzyme)
VKSILQTSQWANFKKSTGWKIFENFGVFVHKRSLPFSKSFLYIPEIEFDHVEENLINWVKQLIQENNCIFTRIEIIDPENEKITKQMFSSGFIRAFEQIQPKWRQIIDISPNEQKILSQMRQKGRYNVRLAERKGVKIASGRSTDFVRTFYGLYAQTIDRERIAGRDLKYFKNMVDKFSDTDYLDIYTATYDREPVAAAVIGFHGGVASYLYGGSSRRHKEVMAPYLMHYQIIKDAKLRGCKTYDLIGRDQPGKSEKWAGVTKFKEQFGGEAVEIAGSFDLVNKKIAYNIFKIAERLRRR